MYRNQTNILKLFPFFVLILLLTSCFGTFRQSMDSVHLNFESKLQSGDLVFRRGISPESYVVIATDRKSRFSHVGILVKENNDWYVIHAVPGENKKGPDFIKKEKLAEFLAPQKASSFAIYRSKFPKAVNESAARHALQFYTNRLLFDNNYDLTTDDKLYCTELVIKAFNQTYLNLKKIHTTEFNFILGKKQLIFPGTLIENPNFTQIINH